MSHEIVLRINSPYSSEDSLLRLVAAAPGFVQREMRVTSIGITSVDIFPEDAFSRKIVQGEHDIAANFRVAFEMDKDDIDTGHLQALIAIVSIMKHCHDDAVVLYDGQNRLLRRKNGHAELMDSTDFWTDSRLLDVARKLY